MTEQEVRDVADSVLSERLRPLGLRHVRVTRGLDHLGEEALYIDAVFGAPSSASLGTAPSDAFRALASELTRRGEARFPYTYARFEDDEPAEDGPRPRH